MSTSTARQPVTSRTDFETIRADLLEDGTVLHLLLDQPKANILSMAMVDELDAALDAHRERRELRLVVLRGAGGRFSYGASVEEHRRDVAPEMLRVFHAFIRRLGTYPVPTAALVEGPCLGGGFEVALCCNLVFATADATFACPEIKLGVFPPVLAVVGRHRLGGAAMDRLLLTGANLPAEEARQLGLVAGILEGDDPMEELLTWYRAHLAPLSARSLRLANEAARTGSGWTTALGETLDAVEKIYLEDVLASHDGNEGIEAFLEKRPPQWTNV